MIIYNYLLFWWKFQLPIYYFSFFEVQYKISTIDIVLGEIIILWVNIG